MLDKRPETARHNLSSVRYILSGAAPLSRELQNTIQQRLNVSVVQGYGMTELTSAIIHVPGGRHDESGSVGLLKPNCDCQILDDDGNPVSLGQPGELYVRGPKVCLGYWKNEQATKEMLDQEGWLKTGDVVILRDDLFWVVDRKNELIKVNALQVSPDELEAVLLKHDGIADARVVGITFQGQEWPRAYVRPTEDKVGALSEVQVQEYVKRNIAKYKQLVGGVKFVNDVPRLASGKIQRKVLGEWAKQDALGMHAKL